MELKRQGQLLVQATQPATPEALSPAPPARLHQLLTSKEQLISMVELMLSQSSQACFGLMRLEFKELRRIANALGEASANALRSEQLERLAALLPDNASCCELNEQEWLMLTPFTATEEQLCSQAAAITEQLQQPIGVAQQLLSSQVAVGAALVQGNYSNAHDLLSDAAIALRNAARRPGSHYSCIDLASRIQAQQDLQLESELRAGLSQGQLEPHFQPLFDLKTREVMGVEALARWRRSDGELLLPSLFLEAAERAELLGELDLQMIRQAIAASHVMARVQPQRPMLLSLNLSGALLESPALLQNLFALIDAEPLPQNWQLQLEMLEVNLQQPEAEIARTLQHLHQRGVFLAIDDFGTGYSSLSRLNRFPFHSLKVDMSFVKLLDAPEQPSNRILEVIQAMADALELHTTAEGVETEAQRQWLQRQGFHWGQGYLLAKPMPLQEILNLLLTQQVQAVPL